MSTFADAYNTLWNRQEVYFYVSGLSNIGNFVQVFDACLCRDYLEINSDRLGFHLRVFPGADKLPFGVYDGVPCESGFCWVQLCSKYNPKPDGDFFTFKEMIYKHLDVDVLHGYLNWKVPGFCYDTWCVSTFNPALFPERQEEVFDVMFRGSDKPNTKFPMFRYWFDSYSPTNRLSQVTFVNK